MGIIRDEQITQLLQNGTDENRDKDNYPVAKLLDLKNKFTWLLVDIDPDDRNFAFALYDCGNGFPEFMYVSLPLLEMGTEKKEFEIIQDPSFTEKYPISVYAKAARKYGFITEEDKLLLPIFKSQKEEFITSTSLIVEVDIEPRIKNFLFENKNITGKTPSLHPFCPEELKQHPKIS